MEDWDCRSSASLDQSYVDILVGGLITFLIKKGTAEIWQILWKSINVNAVLLLISVSDLMVGISHT